MTFIRNPILLVSLLIWIVLVFFLFYLFVRRMFSPLKSLQMGFEKIGSGDLNYQISEKGRHEFQFLFQSFNQMTERLNVLWQGQRRLIRDMSHELRTPVTQLKLSLALQPESDKKNEMEQIVNDLAQIITSLLETEKMESGVLPDLTSVRLKLLLEKVIEKQKKIFSNRNIQLTIAEEIQVLGNSHLLEMAFGNILNNALKYSEGTVVVSGQIKEKELTLSFKDSGLGISKDAQKKLFTPFYRTDESRNKATGGIGLGLNFTSLIIKAHQGRIEVQSELGLGSEFKLIFPV